MLIYQRVEIDFVVLYNGKYEWDNVIISWDILDII